MVAPIDVPDRWEHDGLIVVEEICELVRTPQPTVRQWRASGVGARWARFQGVGRLVGRLCVTVSEARHFLAATAPVERTEGSSDG